ncbi:MAG TPA: imidazole glycerol phosphate synthase subunit HisH [Candidatus Dormibacteraeota bacterium]|nr:imidazole glycerol phosphate synthase subunit HisH [Candidatus Dormibacteraeota bacterium]
MRAGGAAPVVAVCDYGVGNLRSVERALLHAGATVDVTGDAVRLLAADGVVLPGVGAFGAALDALDARGLRGTILRIAESGTPLLGVCLGFQLLFDWSEENGGREGLGILRGRVVRISPARGKVPHMGWNRLRFLRPSSLVDGIGDGAYAYFVHSYEASGVPEGCVVADCDYSGRLPAIVEAGSVAGTQFHPEKSGADGLRLYANFVALCRAAGAAAPGAAPAPLDATA